VITKLYEKVQKRAETGPRIKGFVRLSEVHTLWKGGAEAGAGRAPKSARFREGKGKKTAGGGKGRVNETSTFVRKKGGKHFGVPHQKIPGKKTSGAGNKLESNWQLDG